jgi:signal peptidase I
MINMSPEDNQNQQPEDLTIDSSTSSGTSEEQPKSMSKKSVIREWAEAISIAIILAFTIRVFVVQAFKIPSGSMIPTLLIGDHILVSKVAYGIQLPADCDLHLSFPPMTCYTTKTLINFGEPQRGDIIVFRYPRDEDKDFIKRVIGLPGDNIEIRNKIVHINNQPLRDQEYTQRIDPGMIDGEISERDNFGPIIVPQDSYFVMGDNRDQSLDSRFWGFVKIDKIKGKAFLSYWSWNGQGSWTDLVRWERIGKVIR